MSDLERANYYEKKLNDLLDFVRAMQTLMGCSANTVKIEQCIDEIENQIEYVLENGKE